MRTVNTSMPFASQWAMPRPACSRARRVVAMHQRHGVQVVEGQRHLGIELVLLRQREAALEHLPARRLVGQPQPRAADMVERLAQRLRIADALGQLDRLRAPDLDIGHALADQAQLRQRAVGDGQLGIGRQRFEHLDRLARAVECRGDAVAPAMQPRQPAQADALGAPVAELAVQHERFAPGTDRLAVQAGDRAFERTRLEQRRTFGRCQRRAVKQRQPIEPCRFAVGAARGRESGCARRQPCDLVDQARAFGMVHLPRQRLVGIAGGIAQHGEHLRMQARAPVWRDRLVHRDPRQLMAERERVAARDEQPALQAFVEPRRPRPARWPSGTPGRPGSATGSRVRPRRAQRATGPPAARAPHRSPKAASRCLRSPATR